jgi:DNA primase small subunit
MTADLESLDFTHNLKLYYSKFFPFKEFYQWLSYGNVEKYYFAHREFSFTLPSDAYIRFQSFSDDQVNLVIDRAGIEKGTVATESCKD